MTPTHSIIANNAARRSRQMVHRRALVSGFASAVPVPGLGFLVDVSMVAKLVGDINDAFGLTPEQIDRMTPVRQRIVSQAIVALGTTAVGRAVTRRLIFMLLKRVGIRLAAEEASKYVPIAGQVVSGLLSYSALRIIGERHVQHCETVLAALVEPVGEFPAIPMSEPQALSID